MNHKSLKKIRRSNTVINAGLCLGSIAIFGFNPIALCFCYIGSDIALSLVDKVIENNVIKKNLKNETGKELINFIQEYYHYGDSSPEVRKTLQRLIEEQEKYEQQKEELLRKQQEEEEKRKEEEYQAMLKKVKGLDDVMAVIERFCTFYNTLSKKEIKVKSIKKLHKEFLALKGNLERKPEACFIVNWSFSTYTDEMILLLSSYNSIPSGAKEEYGTKYDEMMQEFLLYLQNINSRIEEFSVTDAKLGLETLISELKEANKEKGAE